MRAVFITVLFAGFIGGCSTRATQAVAKSPGHGNAFEEDLVCQSAMVGVDYPAVAAGCDRRDPASLHTLFWLTAHGGLDGAASESHDQEVANLLRKLGDETFGNTLAAEPADVRAAVRASVCYDFDPDYNADGMIKADWVAEWFPVTFGAEKSR